MNDLTPAAATLARRESIDVPASVCDLASYRAWAHSDAFPETGRVTFVGGEVLVDMSPEEIGSHLYLKRDLTTDLTLFTRQHPLGEVLPDGALFVNDEADVANEPDLMICTWDALQSGRVVYRPFVAGSERLVEVAGSPDLVVEIVSASSVRKDTVLLPPRYFAAGVREYWLIDARGPAVDFRLQVRGEAAFEPVAPDADGFRRSDVLDAAFRLERGTNRLGGTRYRLDVR